jgi:hypothetical protein
MIRDLLEPANMLDRLKLVLLLNYLVEDVRNGIVVEGLFLLNKVFHIKY